MNQAELLRVSFGETFHEEGGHVRAVRDRGIAIVMSEGEIVRVEGTFAAGTEDGDARCRERGSK